MNIENKEVGARIKNIRLSSGWTLEELGEKLDTSKVTVFNWEKGRNKPNKENLKRIAELGKVSVNELLYGDLKQHVYNVLQNELIENGKFALKVKEYLEIEDESIGKVPDKNLRNDIIQIKSEEFLRTHISNIVNNIKNDYFLKDLSSIYENIELIRDFAILYVDLLISDFEDKKIFDEHFKMTYLKGITFENKEQFEDSDKYSFSCSISLETTDDLGNREYVDLDYVSHVIVNIYIHKDGQSNKYTIDGLSALLNEPYQYIYESETYEIAKEYIIKEVLQSLELEEFELQFYDLEELI